MNDQSSIADNPAPKPVMAGDISVLPTPLRVTWRDIESKSTMPPTWQKVGNPDPIPGGALVVTRFMDTRRTKRPYCQVLTWNAETGEMSVLADESKNRAIYTNGSDARAVQHDMARQLRAAVGLNW